MEPGQIMSKNETDAGVKRHSVDAGKTPLQGPTSKGSATPDDEKILGDDGKLIISCPKDNHNEASLFIVVDGHDVAHLVHLLILTPTPLDT